MKYSILIPAYKSSFLYECIGSILSQTYKDFELIIVDDASPQDIKGVVSQFSDSRIRYYRNEKNCGAIHLVDNWNICLSYANGEYVICMGDDDKLLPNCLETYNELMTLYPGLDVYHGLSEIIDDDSAFIELQSPRPDREYVCSLIWNKLNGRSQFIGDFLFRTDVLRKEGGFYDLPMAWASDDISVYRAALTKGIANTRIPVFQYRRNAQTLSNTGDVVVKVGAVHLEKQWVEETLKKIEAKDEVDVRYKYLLNRDLQRLYYIKLYNLFLKDMKFGSFFSPFKWIWHVKELQVSKKMLLRAAIVGFKNRIFSYYG